MVDKNVHRVAVGREQADGLHVDGIVSQSSILRLLRDNMASLGPVGGSQIGTLFAIDGHPFTMPPAAGVLHPASNP